MVSARVLAGRAYWSDPLSVSPQFGGCLVFKRPLVAFVLPTSSYVIVAASVLRRDPAAVCSGFSSTSIPVRRGSQLVSCFNILQVSTTILRATAIAANEYRLLHPDGSSDARKKINYRGGVWHMSHRIQCHAAQGQRADPSSVLTHPSTRCVPRKIWSGQLTEKACRKRQWPIRKCVDAAEASKCGIHGAVFVLEEGATCVR